MCNAVKLTSTCGLTAECPADYRLEEHAAGAREGTVCQRSKVRMCPGIVVLCGGGLMMTVEMIK